MIELHDEWMNEWTMDEWGNELGFFKSDYKRPGKFLHDSISLHFQVNKWIHKWMYKWQNEMKNKISFKVSPQDASLHDSSPPREYFTQFHAASTNWLPK